VLLSFGQGILHWSDKPIQSGQANTLNTKSIVSIPMKSVRAPGFILLVRRMAFWFRFDPPISRSDQVSEIFHAGLSRLETRRFACKRRRTSDLRPEESFMN